MIHSLDNVILSLLLCLHMTLATGQWNIGGVNLPDLGISENPIVQTFFPSAQGVNNPLVFAQQQGTTSPLVTSSGGSVQTPSVGTAPAVNVKVPGLSTGQVLGGSTQTSTGSGTKPSQPVQQPSSFPSNPQVNQQYNGWRWDGNAWQPPAQSGGGPSEADLNAVYQPTQDYLNQAESAVRADFPNVLNSAQQAYESAIAELQGNKQTNQNLITNNTVQAGQQKENALSAARRLYDELRRGYQQRFGGATSAGGAASELANVEQQRQQGGIQQQYGNTLQQIQQQQQKLESDYQTGSMKILQSKNDAIAQANRDFQNQLLSISQQRAQTESAKAAARLDALNQLRNQAYAAQQQALTYQQNLDMFYKQQQADVATYAQKLALAGQGSASALAGFNPNMNPTSTLGINGSVAQTSPSMVGQINSNVAPPGWKLVNGQWVQTG